MTHLAASCCLVSALSKHGWQQKKKSSIHLEASDVDRHQVLADLGPLDRPGTGGRHVKHLGPQTADWNAEQEEKGSLFFAVSFPVSEAQP
jgi:hypothetical protein